MSSDRVWLRWAFLAIGLFLMLAPGIILHRVLNVLSWAGTLHPGNPIAQAKFILVVLSSMLLVGALCLVTAWGMKRNRSWARGTGIAACLGLLCGFPWLTLAGAIGLCAVFLTPRPTVEIAVEDTSRLRPHESLLDWIIGASTGVLLLAGVRWLIHYARILGLPHVRLGKEFWLVLILGELLVITVHEFGHALAAWAVHFRFKVINVGPVTVWKDATGHRHSRFEWKRLLVGGGYMGAVPTSDRSVRLNQILVIFAGPFVSLNAGLLLFLLFLNLPGTAWQHSWDKIGTVAILFGVDFIRNLIPIGYTDGTLLLHLILWTPKGREFASAWLAAKDKEEADEREAHVDFEREVELRRRVLEQALAHGDQNSVELAFKYQALGFAELRAMRPHEAEQSLRTSLHILQQCRAAPALLAANSWMGLYRAHFSQQRPAEAAQACTSAVRAFEKSKKSLTRESLVDVQKALAQLHIDSRAYEAALHEIEGALASFPSGRAHLLRKATFLRQRAECEFYLGSPDAALAAATKAADILRSPELPESARSQAASDLATLGVSFWMAGRTEQAIALLSESIQSLEARGAVNRVARVRVTLAEVLRKAGRLPEAQVALPNQEELTPDIRETFLRQQAQIHLRAGQIAEAIAGLEEALRLKKADQHASAAEIATAEGSLAEAFLDASRVEEAETLARRSCDVLVPMGHPNAAGSLITLALISKQSPYTDEALRLISEAQLLKTASKARFLEAAAARLERYDWIHKAEEFRAAAEAQWQTFGPTTVPAEAVAS